MGTMAVLRAKTRRWMGVLAVGLVFGLTLSPDSAFAADKAPTDTKAADKKAVDKKAMEKKAGTAPVTKSMITGTPFPKPPMALADDGTYAGFTGMIAEENGKRCRSLEAFGWDLAAGDQKGLQAIVDATMDAMQNGGYKATQIKSKTAEGSPAVIIEIDNAKKHGFVVWGPIGKGLVLLICETAPQTKAPAAKAPAAKAK